MLFNSYEFLFVFLPAVFVGFFWIAQNNQRLAAFWLAAASVFFYGYWNPIFVSLLLISIVSNYWAGQWVGKTSDSGRYGKLVLGIVIAINLVVLAYFKYANFFLTAMGSIAGQSLTPLEIILPLGISFFTFTQIAFLVDVHRKIANEYSFIHYLLFVTYFPHLIAGPVLHHKQMMPQFASEKTYRINWENIAIGASIFTLGLAKKVLIADSLAPIADSVFDATHNGARIMLIEAWIGALAYSFQLYFDFSGYSDMAIGLSRMFNVRLPLNFDSPYRATSIIDFWRRWHMTLSAFLRDYLYLPLGGNRHGKFRRYFNLMVTMLLGGLWHGANWTFVVWGGLHGLFLIVNHGWRGFLAQVGWRWRRPTWIGRLFAWALTFCCVVVGWVFFRAENFADAQSLLAGMISFNGISVSDTGFGKLLSDYIASPVVLNGFIPLIEKSTAMHTSEVILIVLIAASCAWLFPNTQQMCAGRTPAWDETRVERAFPARLLYDKWATNTPWALFLGVVLALSISGFNRASAFLYFQF
jgi:alginate O-acetyltransferase complex protein AlgI